MKLKLTLIFFVLLFASGCANFATGRYSTSVDNTEALKAFGDVKIDVGDFVDKNNVAEIACHYHGPVTTIDGEPFVKFIQKAFTDELKVAGLYSKSAPVTIKADLEEVDYMTAFGHEWNIKLSLTSSKGRSTIVKERYEYKGSVFAAPGGECAQAALAFVPAVQNLIAKVIAELPKLVN